MSKGGHGGKGGGGRFSPNIMRSNAKNPNNAAYRAAISNRSNQLNPNNPAYRSSRSGTEGGGLPNPSRQSEIQERTLSMKMSREL